ncbi:MAG: PDZ domain-containing protein [Dehalococcoidia bacterium]|nr:PDZ domain-containing protein [Dehalococcoidia bacterium]
MNGVLAAARGNEAPRPGGKWEETVKKLLIAVVLALVAAAVLVPVVVFASPSSGGGSQQAASQARPWLGVAIAPLTPRVADKLGLSGKTGLLVRQVVADSPAATAGLKQNDLITAVNSSPVTTLKELADAASAAGVGGSLALSVLRDGAALPAITIQLAERPARPALAHLPSLQHRGKLHQGSATYEDKDGNVVTLSVVAGRVAAKGDGAITIKPNGGGADITVSLAGGVTLAKGAREATLDQVEIGSPATIISKNGQVQRVQVGGGFPHGMLPAFRGGMGPRHHMIPGHDMKPEFKGMPEAQNGFRGHINGMPAPQPAPAFSGGI